MTGQLVTLPRIAKDNKRYDVNVETIPAKFAPQKKVSHSYVADDYVKSIKLVLNKTAITQRPNKQVNWLEFLYPFPVSFRWRTLNHVPFWPLKKFVKLQWAISNLTTFDDFFYLAVDYVNKFIPATNYVWLSELRTPVIAFFVENIYDLNWKIKDDNQIIFKIYVF